MDAFRETLANAHLLSGRRSRVLLGTKKSPGDEGRRGTQGCVSSQTYFLALPWLATALIFASMVAGSPM